MKRISWDYAAGFVDGEGTITFERYFTRSGRYSLMPLLVVDQKKREPLTYIHRLFGMGKIKSVVNGKYKGFRLVIRGLRLLPILSKLEPILVVKRDQAKILISFINHKSRCTFRAPLDQLCLRLDKDMRKKNLRGGSGQHNSFLKRPGEPRRTPR